MAHFIQRKYTQMINNVIYAKAKLQFLLIDIDIVHFRIPSNVDQKTIPKKN